MSRLRPWRAESRAYKAATSRDRWESEKWHARGARVRALARTKRTPWQTRDAQLESDQSSVTHYNVWQVVWLPGTTTDTDKYNISGLVFFSLFFFHSQRRERALVFPKTSVLLVFWWESEGTCLPKPAKKRCFTNKFNQFYRRGDLAKM